MRTRAMGAASVLTLALAACGSPESANTGGTGNSAGPGGGTGCGSTMFSPNAECQACVQSSCCTDLEACTKGTSCAALLDCLTANQCSASDSACITTCEDQHGDGVAPAQALELCYNGSCETAAVCQTGAICESGLEVENVQCGMCLGSGCCSEWTACGADATCTACATSQGTDSGCADVMLYTAATDCEKSKCSSDCTQICSTSLSTNNPPCDLCLSMYCCSAFAACIQDSTCDTCLLSASPPAGCPDDTAYTTATLCQSTNCATQCASGS